MLRKELIIAVFSFIIVAGIIFFAADKNKQENINPTPIPANSTDQSVSEGEAMVEQEMMDTEILTEQVVAKHNKPDDCWFIIDGNVYDVTDYDQHPGGRDRIEAFCGKDATQAFSTKGEKGEPHSQKAQGFLKNFYFGQLGEEIEK